VLTISVKTLNSGAILKCQGRIVHGVETALLGAAVRQQHGRIVLDIAGVEVIDAAGIGMLVSLQAAGVYLVLFHANENVREVLRITHVDSVLEICESKSVHEISLDSPEKATEQERVFHSEPSAMAFR
jgi:anti-anti-sigma factor